MAEKVSGANFFTASVTMAGIIPVGGGWTKVDGLGITIGKEEKEEGGNPYFRRLLIKGITYPEVTLTRPVQSDSTMLRMQIASIAAAFAPVEVVVKLHTPKGDEIATWQLMHATITSYKAPSFGITNTGIAEESITVHHQGFLETFLSAMAGALGAKAVGV